MRNRLRASRLSRPRSAVPPALAAAASAAALAAALAGCGSVAAPGTASGQASPAGPGTATSPAASQAGATSQGVATGPGSPSASASPSGTPSASSPATVTCTTAGLKVVLDTAVEGVAAGSYFVPLDFTNTSGRACQLIGYPAVALTSGRAGQPLGAAAAVDRSVRASAVLLAPGAVAHAWLQLLSAASYPASKCHPVTAAGLQVTAPGGQGVSYVAHRVPACRTVIQGSELLIVHPVQPGRARRGTA